MKAIAVFFVSCLIFAQSPVRAAPLSGTLGSNLTAYNPNGNAGAMNNNQWNSMANGRASGGNMTNAPADFGNCNSIILRCASPKCANGGCTSIEIATPIVAGCVQSNDACRQYEKQGIIESIAAQLVANSVAKNNQAANAAAAAAANEAAQQSAEQLAQMQSQMQAMQQSMQQQNEALQRELAAQREEAAAAAAAAAERASAANAITDTTMDNSAAATVPDGVTAAQQIAAANGVPAELLVREQVGPQIITHLDNAQVALDKLKAVMENAFTYAGCDGTGNNCSGPKRVSVFKSKANEFFPAYENVQDEIYEALLLAQAVGIDINDVVMLLSDSCPQYALYVCNDGYEYENPGEKTGRRWKRYNSDTCKNGLSTATEGLKAGFECQDGMVIPPEATTYCSVTRVLNDAEEVQRQWLYAETGEMDENLRVGCVGNALKNAAFLGRSRKNATRVDIDVLQRIIAQDAPPTNRSGSDSTQQAKTKYCRMTYAGYANLEQMLASRRLPSRVCVSPAYLDTAYNSDGLISADGFDKYGVTGISKCPEVIGMYTTEIQCKTANCHWDGSKCVLQNSPVHDGTHWEFDPNTGYCIAVEGVSPCHRQSWSASAATLFGTSDGYVLKIPSLTQGSVLNNLTNTPMYNTASFK